MTDTPRQRALVIIPTYDERENLPREGGLAWTDAVGIPSGAVNIDQAYALLDHLFDPAVGAEALRMGRSVLRTSTAGVAATAAILSRSPRWR